MFLWIASLEDGAIFDNEHFLPTYGQLLAVFVAVPPLIQLITMLPRLGPWFIELTWVRFLTCRLDDRQPSEGSGEQPSEESVKKPMDSPIQESPEISMEPRLSYDQRPKGMHHQYSSYDSGRSLKTIAENEKSEMMTEAPTAMDIV